MPKIIWRRLEINEIVEQGDVWANAELDKVGADIGWANDDDATVHFVSTSIGRTVEEAVTTIFTSGKRLYRFVGVEPFMGAPKPILDERKIELEL